MNLLQLPAPFVLAHRLREPFSALSHYTGALFSTVALVIMLVISRGRPLYIASSCIYGFSLIFLFTASALSHSLRVNKLVQTRLSRCDYIGIFLLIAGSYVPLCLISLHGYYGWRLLAAEYTLAGVGIASVLIFSSMPHSFRVPIYIVMGWLVLFVLHPLILAVTQIGLYWMLTGGFAYMTGVVILALDKPHLLPGRFSAHDLWHLCVIVGSVCHFIFVTRFILSTS